MIPPQELKKKAFTHGFRGYEPTEVDEYIDFLIEKYTELFSQCDEYHNKLRLVASRIDEMKSEEEAIHELVISTQKHCENMTKEAEFNAEKIVYEANETAKSIISEAEQKEEQILVNAKHIAETTLAAISRKAENHINATNEKTEALLMSARTRCAKILSSFKKEITAQRNGLLQMKGIVEEFNNTLLTMYKEHLNSLNSNMPIINIDLDELTESKLLDSIMQDIKNDAANIADRNKDKEYDFQEELGALQIEIDNIATASHSSEGEVQAVSGTESSEDYEKTTVFSKVPESASVREDAKVLAGKAASKGEGDTVTFDRSTMGGSPSSPPEHEQYDNDESDDEEPVSTYDSDDFREYDYSDNAAASQPSRYSDNKRANDAVKRDAKKSDGNSSDEYDFSSLSTEDDDSNDSEDTMKKGFLSTLFGKKKSVKKFSKPKDDDDDIDYTLDDDDDDEYDIDIDEV